MSERTKMSVLILLWAAGISCISGAVEGTDSQQEQPMSDSVDVVLEKLNQRTLELVSYEAQVEYKFKQPLLFESQSLRKGILYYSKQDEEINFRVNFQTLKEDEEDEQKYILQCIVLDGASISNSEKQFLGVWLVYIDYHTEELKYFQLAEQNDPNGPTDVFDLISANLPIVGFTGIEDLKKQFDITLVEQKEPEPQEYIQVHLKVKPNSVYRDKYTYMDCWINKESFLPIKIIAVTTEEDIYDIKFLSPKINNKIDEKVFDFTIPKGFDEPEIIPIQ